MQLESNHNSRKNQKKSLNQVDQTDLEPTSTEPSLKRPKIGSFATVESTEYYPTIDSLEPAENDTTTTAETLVRKSDQPLVHSVIPSPQSFLPAPQEASKDLTSPIPDSAHLIKYNTEPVSQDLLITNQDPARDIKEHKKFATMYISIFFFALLGLVFFKAGSVPVMRSVMTASNATNATHSTNNTSTVPSNSLDSKNNTLYEDFISALSENNVSSVTELLAKDPSLANISDQNGWLPIHEAASNGYVEIVQTLLKQSKEHINARTTTGGSVLYWALEGTAAHDHDHPMIQELMKHGAINYPPDQPVASDTTVTLEIIANFNTAAAENDIEKLSSILAEYPDVINHSDINGYQALHEAAQYGHTEAVEFLIENGASVFTRVGADFNGATALYLALDNGFESEHPAVVALWNAGAIPLAEGFIFTDIAPEYTNVGFAPLDMAEAVRAGDCELLAEYADERPNWLRIMDENGWLPLHEAATLGHIDCVDVIVNALNDEDFINVRVFGSGGSALYFAKQELGEDSPMVAHLVSLGAEELEPIPDEL